MEQYRIEIYPAKGDSGGVKLTGGLSPAEARELMTSGQRGWFMTDVMLLAGLYPRSFGA